MIVETPKRPRRKFKIRKPFIHSRSVKTEGALDRKKKPRHAWSRKQKKQECPPAPDHSLLNKTKFKSNLFVSTTPLTPALLELNERPNLAAAVCPISTVQTLYCSVVARGRGEDGPKEGRKGAGVYRVDVIQRPRQRKTRKAKTAEADGLRSGLWKCGSGSSGHGGSTLDRQNRVGGRAREPM